jgi:hypothetical protein
LNSSNSIGSLVIVGIPYHLVASAASCLAATGPENHTAQRNNTPLDAGSRFACCVGLWRIQHNPRAMLRLPNLSGAKMQEHRRIGNLDPETRSLLTCSRQQRVGGELCSEV